MKRYFQSIVYALLIAGFIACDASLDPAASTTSTGGGSIGAITISTSAALPSSASTSVSSDSRSYATSDNGRSYVAVTEGLTDTPVIGYTNEVYKGDTLLGSCLTGSDGTCSVNADIDEGTHTLFIQTKNLSGTVVAGAILDQTITTDTTTFSAPVDSTRSLAFSAWKASCRKKAGADCVPGVNAEVGAALVVPDCIDKVLRDMVGSTSAVDDSSAGGRMRAMFEAHKSSLAEAIGTGGTPPIDMDCMLRGETGCGEITGTIGTAGVTGDNAKTTAASALDAVTESLCDDPTNYATMKADPDFIADPGVVANPFTVADVSQIELLKVPATAKKFKDVILNTRSVTDGMKFMGDPLGADSIFETFMAGGYDGITTAEDYSKRSGAITGGGIPADAVQAKKRGLAALAIFATDNFAIASGAQAIDVWGPMLSDETLTNDFIDNGKSAVDRVINQAGGYAAYTSEAGGIDMSDPVARAAYYNDFQSKDCGADCSTNTKVCRTDLRCYASTCTAYNDDGTIIQTGCPKPGGSCAVDGDCPTTDMKCRTTVGRCVITANQQGITFGANSGVENDIITLGTTQGALCNSESNGSCATGLVCMPGKNKCVSALPSGSGVPGDTCDDGFEDCASGFCDFAAPGTDPGKGLCAAREDAPTGTGSSTTGTGVSGTGTSGTGTTTGTSTGTTTGTSTGTTTGTSTVGTTTGTSTGTTGTGTSTGTTGTGTSTGTTGTGTTGGTTGGGGETVCNDFFDNDEDSFTDCADPDCVGLAGDFNEPPNLCQATEAACNDAFDNDGDSDTDCLDSDCEFAAECL